MFKGEIKMTAKDLKRLEIIQKVDEKRLKQREAARILGCVPRTIQLLLHKYRTEGPPGLISKRRGKISNRAFSNEFKTKVLEIVGSTLYEGFGPTFAAETLEERASLKVSKETVRQWMIEGGIWKNKQVRVSQPHPPRERRHHYGSLIQIDGSPHDWFEGRGPKCTLIVFIDDATSKIQLMRFFPTETTFAYFQVMQLYIERYGMPQELYSDRHGIFRVNHPEPESGTGLTQFGRAMEDLGLRLLHASSPQAKGRVEKQNRTLQDRLVKTMRLDGINNMEMANGGYLDKMATKLNTRFSVPPFNKDDAHVIIQNCSDLTLYFTLQELRTVSKNLTISYKNKKYVLKKPDKVRGLCQAKVTVCEAESGEITILYKQQSLEYTVYDKNQYYSEVVSRKDLGPVSLALPRYHKPAANHPWKKLFKPEHV